MVIDPNNHTMNFPYKNTYYLETITANMENPNQDTYHTLNSQAQDFQDCELLTQQLWLHIPECSKKYIHI